MVNWLLTLLKALELETVDIELLDCIDDVLNWEMLRGQNDLYLKLLEELGEDSLNIRFEELLDRLIVGDYALGEMFPNSLSEEHAKKRYRKLIRIFHPDKGFKSQVWLNYRAEKINKAYQVYVKRDLDVYISGANSVSEKKTNENKLQSEPTRKKPNVKFRYRSDVWRDRLGDAKQFQKKVLTVLLVASFSLIVLVYWANKEVANSSYLKELNKNGGGALVAPIVGVDLASDEYIKDERAKEILQEADRLLFNDENISEDVVINHSLLSGNGRPQNPVELEDFINELEKIGLESSAKLKDECIGYSNLSSSVVTGDKKNTRTLVSDLYLYSGPSKECSLLSVLDAESQIILFSRSEDGLWIKAISSQDQGLAGWVEAIELNSVKNEEAPRLSNEDEVLVKKEIINKMEFKANRFPEDVVVVQPFLKPVAPSKAYTENSKVREVKLSNSNASHSSKNSPAPIFINLVEQLKQNYQLGDSDQLAELYIRSGRENKIRGADQIRKYYKKAFKRTTDRKFNYVIESFEEKDGSTAIIEGRVSLSMKTLKTGLVNNIEAEFTIWVLRLGDSYKIVSFEWSEA